MRVRDYATEAHFILEDENDMKTPVQCRHCPKKLKRRNISKMKEHLDECDEYKKKLTEIDNAVETISRFVDKLSRKELLHLRYLLAKAAFEDGRPFTLYESKAMRNTFKIIRPALTPPNRQQMAGPLLNKVFEYYTKMVAEIIAKYDHLSFTIDSWGDKNKNRWINLCVVDPSDKTSYFINAFLCEDQNETAVNIKKWIIQMWKENNIPPPKIASLTTDTCAVMQLLWKELNKDKEYTHVFTGPCLAHVLNLVIQDVLEITQYKTVSEQAHSFCKHLNASPLQLAKFREIQATMLGKILAIITPALTRWGTHYGMIESLIRSRQVIIQYVQEHLQKSDALRLSILDPSWWNKLEELRNVLRPITWTLKRFDSDDITIAQVRELWKRMTIKVQQTYADGEQKVLDILAERWKYIGENTQNLYNFAFALNPMYLHHKHARFDLDSQEQENLEKWIESEIGKEGKEEFDRYTSQTHHYLPRKSSYNEPDPTVFWGKVQVWGKGEFTEKFAMFAKCVLSIPSTSTASERNWSAFGRIYSQLRNRLTPLKAFKLTYIYTNSRTFDEEAKAKRKEAARK
eukprot:TRINITY_DN3545_c0_g1_i1.p1 TRINITY_DN3545_c0_g1~~TRINITY_DN3545_c0_g1_i1.p1  ORF type:complete len:573 (-),score=99.89 TRINITY_DN3545_c0_g1_i1:340-2058(-)